jgi:hypothetical protein
MAAISEGILPWRRSTPRFAAAAALDRKVSAQLDDVRPLDVWLDAVGASRSKCPSRGLH